MSRGHSTRPAHRTDFLDFLGFSRSRYTKFKPHEPLIAMARYDRSTRQSAEVRDSTIPTLGSCRTLFLPFCHFKHAHTTTFRLPWAIVDDVKPGSAIKHRAIGTDSCQPTATKGYFFKSRRCQKNEFAIYRKTHKSADLPYHARGLTTMSSSSPEFQAGSGPPSHPSASAPDQCDC